MGRERAFKVAPRPLDIADATDADDEATQPLGVVGGPRERVAGDGHPLLGGREGAVGGAVRLLVVDELLESIDERDRGGVVPGVAPHPRPGLLHRPQHLDLAWLHGRHSNTTTGGPPRASHTQPLTSKVNRS